MPSDDVKLGAWTVLFVLLLALGARFTLQQVRLERTREREAERAAALLEGGSRVLQLLDVASGSAPRHAGG